MKWYLVISRRACDFIINAHAQREEKNFHIHNTLVPNLLYIENGENLL